MAMHIYKGLLVLLLILLVPIAEASNLRISAFDLAVAPYGYSLAQWGVGHFMDKWVRKLAQIRPWHSDPTRQETIAQVQEFFTLGQELQRLERTLSLPSAGTDTPLPEAQAQSLRQEIARIRARRRELQPRVEEVVESEVSTVIAQEGFSSRIGLIFPPVDTVFSTSPHVLVVSPRDRILRQRMTFLASNITTNEKERLESLVLREENLAALVEATGGVASYPSVVSDAFGLHHAVVATAHEWLHHWFFFHPLGRHFGSSPEMTALNETAATIGGNEIGDLVFQAMTGQAVDRTPPPRRPDANVFNFNTEMRQTRLHTEELLALGKIDEAEAYMEERRQLMVANGYMIRKINQAYFAFHGTYATSPASVSPIEGQLSELRGRSKSLGDFLKTVARFGSYQEFLDYLNILPGPLFHRPDQPLPASLSNREWRAKRYTPVLRQARNQQTVKGPPVLHQP